MAHRGTPSSCHISRPASAKTEQGGSSDARHQDRVQSSITHAPPAVGGQVRQYANEATQATERAPDLRLREAEGAGELAHEAVLDPVAITQTMQTPTRAAETAEPLNAGPFPLELPLEEEGALLLMLFNMVIDTVRKASK